MDKDVRNMVMDPNEVLHTATEEALTELDSDNPFLCVECGSTFECIDDVIFHIMVDHDLIMFKKDGKLIPYSKFMEELSKKISDYITEADGDQS